MEKRSAVITRFGQLILSPWATAVALVLAVGLGLWLPRGALALKPVGGVYLALLQMCSLPLVICGVVSSIGRILRDGESKHYLGRLVLVVVGGLFITAALAVVLGLAVRPGSGLSTEASQTLGRLLSESEVQGSAGTMEHKAVSFVDFLSSAVPRNIFYALSQGSQLPILFFSLVLGVALGFTTSLKSQQTIESFEATFDALLKLIEWLLYLLPIGLISLLAPQIAEAGFGVLVAMLKLIVLVNVAALISLLAGNLIIARRTGQPYFTVLRQLIDCLLIAFATKSSFAAIPSALSAMQRLGMSKNTTDLVIPLSVSLNPIGNVHYYTLSAIFIAQLYGVSFPRFVARHPSYRWRAGRRGGQRTPQRRRDRRDLDSSRTARPPGRRGCHPDHGHRPIHRPRDHHAQRPRQLRRRQPCRRPQHRHDPASLCHENCLRPHLNPATTTS